ncbi:MAG: hypothetical protein OXC44_04235 [Proteobacteria bacterium]|nr:hypothetical protein [Pseudomonadota bacterium]
MNGLRVILMRHFEGDGEFGCMKTESWSHDVAQDFLRVAFFEKM